MNKMIRPSLYERIPQTEETNDLKRAAALLEAHTRDVS